jgi:hypothetical protein
VEPLSRKGREEEGLCRAAQKRRAGMVLMRHEHGNGHVFKDCSRWSAEDEFTQS